MHDQRPVIAGLRLKWQEIRAPRRDGEPADEAEAYVGLWVLDDPDAMLDAITQEEFDRNDERMPYFAMIWPSADSLVAAVLSGPRLDGQQVLDLGCGLGEPRALEIVAASAERQPAPAATFRCVVGDWRQPPPLGPFDLILGADLLYEQRNAPAVAAFLARHLKPGAEAWIADPGRPQAGPFLALAEGAGLDLVSQETLPARPHGATIALVRLWRPVVSHQSSGIGDSGRAPDG
jgi:SAM-dependent methyltransferase